MPDPTDTQILIKILEHLTRVETIVEGQVLAELRLLRTQIGRLATILDNNAEGTRPHG